ncbi:cytochrome P450 [Bombardia bombarda]|uniref:Cytochrome P450 n=1 Tax=Bombardia bombarda TaxID=252184 RepID=A0AA40BVS6_9PEZI|nr:cytochrome P450 [Bombardia bombarda]
MTMTMTMTMTMKSVESSLERLLTHEDVAHVLASVRRSPYISFGILIVAFLAALVLQRRYFSALSDLPGPFWASISRSWHAYHIFTGDHNLHLLDLHEKHGHFVRIAPNEVSVSHPDGPRLLLQSHLRKGNWYRAFAVPDQRYQTPQSTLDPREKIERSKSFISGFSMSHLLRSEEHFDRNISRLLDWMDRFAETEEPMHLDKFFSYVAFDNAGEAIFSRSFGFIDQGRDVGDAIQNSRSLNCYMGIAGYYLWFHRLFVANPVITWSGLLPMGHLFATANKALEARRRDPDARFDIVAHWFRIHKENPKQLSLRDIEAQATVSVAGGSDTLSCSLQSFVYHMIQQPASWKRARDEIRAAQAQGRCQSRVISYEDTQQLPYTLACVYEGLRKFGPGPFGFPRVAPKGGIDIGGRHFPEGTILSVNPQIMQNSKDCWGDDVKEWNPDRWLKKDDQGETTSGIEKMDKYWLVFGMGYNRCPGEHLAAIQLFKIAATIVRDYDIAQVDPENEWKWKAYFTVVPHSWPVRIVKV